MQIAITGASGFIGSRLCESLCTAGHRVRALSRSGELPLAPGLEPVKGSLQDPASLRALVVGADAVLHLAGAVRGADAPAFEEPNVAGTGRLLDAIDAAAAGTPLLFFSSLAAREPALSHYARSKHLAEELVRRRCSSSRPCLILRPPAVYGPGDREMLPVFRFMARTGLAPAAGSAASRLSLIYVEDLVAAALAWLDSGLGISATCSLHDGHEGGYGWHELADIVGRACGHKVRVWEIPQLPLDAAARVNLAWSKVSGQAPMLTPAKLRELRHPDWVCDNTAISAMLGWQPRVGLAQGLALTPGWRR